MKSSNIISQEMKELNEEERKFLKELIKYEPTIHNGYYSFKIENKHYKQSRVLMQLFLNKKLSIHHVIHHKDENKLNDSIDNLEVVSVRIHGSIHGGRRNKRYKKRGVKVSKIKWKE